VKKNVILNDKKNISENILEEKKFSKVQKKSDKQKIFSLKDSELTEEDKKIEDRTKR